MAQLTGRTLADILAETLDILLQPIGIDSQAETSPVAGLSNAEVLALADSHMESDQDTRMSELLYDQQARTLAESEEAELTMLLQVYQEGLLRKAQALNEAIKRDLRKPLEP